MTRRNKVREDWEIRDDARTLARAEEIKADKERLADAQMMAKKIAQEEINRMNGMLKVAGKPTPKMPKDMQPHPQQDSFNRGYNNPATLGRF